jgi:hypothetical protein
MILVILKICQKQVIYLNSKMTLHLLSFLQYQLKFAFHMNYQFYQHICQKLKKLNR